jgi:sporulation protein YlmC with PRC-barrel domain
MEMRQRGAPQVRHPGKQMPMKLEDLRPGASVSSRDGHKLGRLSRFVLTKDLTTLTHVVVDTGLLRSGESLLGGGWALSHDRVVPLGVVDDVSPDAVTLTMTAEEFRDLSVDYIQEYFEPIPDEKKGWPDPSDLRRLAASIPGEPGPYFMLQTMAKSPDEVDIKKDSPVWRMNPHQKIGEVDGLVVEEGTGKVQAIVVRRGHVFTKDVELPLRFVAEVVADIVRVHISDDALKQLREHHPQA